MTRSIFVTGTDTDVGKTAVTALAAAHLAKTRINFRAVKPFCSGERTDALLLQALQEQSLSLQEVNPFYFPDPVSPWTAARRANNSVSLNQVLNYLRQQANACDLLLVEGAGGLFSPLGDRFNAADLIVNLQSEVIVVAANRLGVLNHTVLTIEALMRRNVVKIKIALVDLGATESAPSTNEEDLRLLLTDIPLLRIPFLPGYKAERRFIRTAAERLNDVLEKLTSPASVAVQNRLSH